MLHSPNLSFLAGEPFIDGQPVPYDPKYHSSWITIQNHLQGIDIDLDEDTEEEIEDTDAEIPDTDAAATVNEIPDTCAAATANEIPHTTDAASAATAGEIPDMGAKWYSLRDWLSKVRQWWKV